MGFIPVADIVGNNKSNDVDFKRIEIDEQMRMMYKKMRIM